MMVRRFSVTAALTVALIAYYAPAGWASSSTYFNGGANAPLALSAVAGARTVAYVQRAHASSARRTAARDHSARHAAPAKHSKPKKNEFAFENTPLHLSGTSSSTHAASSSGGGSSIARTLLGLIVVVGAIYGVAWVLRRVKRGRETQASGMGLASVATLPLGSGRTLHLVRAGSDVILVGSSEHGVAPVRVYSEEEALANGLISDADPEEAMRAAAGEAQGPLGTGRPPNSGNGAAWRSVNARETPGERALAALRRLTVRS
jgi:flagellar protein FliO/FliZ